MLKSPPQNNIGLSPPTLTKFMPRNRTHSSNYIKKIDGYRTPSKNIVKNKTQKKSINQKVLDSQKSVRQTVKLVNAPIEQQIVERKLTNKFIKLPSVNGLQILQKNSQYTVQKQIGCGAFSKVYSAIRKVDGLNCVIKVYEKSQISSQARRQNLVNQLRALKLPYHPNIIRYIGQLETNTQTVIVMQYFTTASLTQFAKSNRPLNSQTLKNITKQLCSSLIHLHQNGVSHRDIKPDNILVKSINKNQVQIKIIDFGFATNGSEDQVTVAGTPYFMPPQLINKKGYDPVKADVWALGIMLYWLATGYYPQQASMPNSIKQIKIKRKDRINGASKFNLNFPIDIDPGLEYLLQKILNPDPSQRITLAQIIQDTWIKPRSLKAQIDKLRKSCQINLNQQI